MKITARKGHEREYGIWQAMKSRCYNKNHIHYNDYGGRGITICDRWLGPDGFKHFLEDMFPCPNKATLDRIDNNKGYSPENCKWSTLVEQANNRRNNVYITFNGKRKTAPQWAREIGIPIYTLKTRLRRGMPIEKALSSKKYR